MSEPETSLDFLNKQDGGPWPAQGEWTYDDYRRLPDDGRRYEVIRGVLHVTSTPRLLHQYVGSELLWIFQSFVRKRRLGQVLSGPLELRLAGGVATPIQPDVLFIHRGKAPDWTRQSLTVVPDLVAEIVSPGSGRFDRIVKLSAYQEAGVLEYWLIDLKARTIVVYVLNDEGHYTEWSRAGFEETVSSCILTRLRVKVSELFPPEE